MEPSLIYAKTPKGLIEVQTRSGRLSPVMRRVLIMINGRSEFADLEPAVPVGQLEGIIAALESEGLIEVCEVIPTALVPEGETDGLSFDLALPQGLADLVPQRLEPRFNLAPPPFATTGGPPTAGPHSVGPNSIGPNSVGPNSVGPNGAVAVARRSVTAPASPPISSLPPAQGLDERKSRAVRELFNLLGPYGESAAVAIRESTTIGDLLDSLREAGGRISIFRGQAVARDYLRAHGIDVDAMIAAREAQSRG